MMKEFSFWGELTNPLNVTNLLVNYLNGFNLVKNAQITWPVTVVTQVVSERQLSLNNNDFQSL